MNEKLLRDRKVGEDFEDYFLLTGLELKRTKTNKPYITCTIQDKSESLRGNLWAITNSIDVDLLSEVDFVLVKGSIDEYNGNRQVRIDYMRPAYDTEDFDKKNLLPIIEEDPRVLFRELTQVVNSISDDDIRNICVEILREKQKDLVVAPAAISAHHYEIGGLLLHISEMLSIGKALVNIFPDVNRDYLYAGIILHDIGKIDEMNRNSVGLVDKYTLEGELLGHITMGLNYIQNTADRLNIPDEKILPLLHMILSHHGKPEYGSPKSPMFIEAEFLHYCDVISSRFDMYKKATRDLEKGELSVNNFFIGSKAMKI